jgi:hypothetical protein
VVTALPANVNLTQLLAANPGTTIVGTEPLESVQSGTSVAFTLNQVLSFAQSNFSIGKLAAVSGLSVLGVTGTASATVAAIAGVAAQILAVNAAGTGLLFTGAPTLATSVTAPLFNASNTAIGYEINATTIINFLTNYTVIYAPDGAQGLVLGNATDPTNYYKAATHAFRDRSSVTKATIPMGPVVSGGTTSLGFIFTVPNVGMFVGTGAPTLAAGTSSIYFRNDGATNTSRLYINTNGSTGWTAVTA